MKLQAVLFVAWCFLGSIQFAQAGPLLQELGLEDQIRSLIQDMFQDDTIDSTDDCPAPICPSECEGELKLEYPMTRIGPECLICVCDNGEEPMPDMRKRRRPNKGGGSASDIVGQIAGDVLGNIAGTLVGNALQPAPTSAQQPQPPQPQPPQPDQEDPRDVMEASPRMAEIPSTNQGDDKTMYDAVEKYIPDPAARSAFMGEFGQEIEDAAGNASELLLRRILDEDKALDKENEDGTVLPTSRWLPLTSIAGLIDAGTTIASSIKHVIDGFTDPEVDCGGDPRCMAGKGAGKVWTKVADYFGWSDSPNKETIDITKSSTMRPEVDNNDF